MGWRRAALLAFLGLFLAWGVAVFQHSPGYMDADYYAVTGMQLAQGRGFSEPFLWNYLDDPDGIPHPSHSYWMPLSSLLAAAVPSLAGRWTWFAARLPFILTAALIPPLTAALAYSITKRRDLALVSGFLAVFSGYYLSYLPTTDTFGIYMLFGGLFFLLVASRFSIINSLLLGVISGLMHLSRADGLLWPLIAFLAIIIHQRNIRKPILFFVCCLLVSFLGYLLIMAPWFARNLSVFGTILAPGSANALWMTSYNQLFSYPAGQVSFEAWKQAGLVAALEARIWALGLNLGTTLGVQGLVFLLPLMFLGLWALRKEPATIIAILAWLMLFGLMTVIFPFAGARGGYFHSGAAFQPFLWSVAPLGLESAVAWVARKRGWYQVQAGRVFMATLVLFAVMITVIVVQGRVVGSNPGNPAWDQEFQASLLIEEFLASNGAADHDKVMIANPPGYFFAAGRSGVVTPHGDLQTVLEVAERYGISYLVLEKGHIVEGLQPLFDQPESFPEIRYLGEVDEARIFVFQP